MPTSQTSKRKRKVGRESGQSLVEFALALMFVILPMLMIFIETSVILYKYVALNNAAREGARAGSIYLYVGDPGGSYAAPDAGREAFVTTNVGQTLRPLVALPPDCNGGTGSSTTCQISYGPSSSPFFDPLRSTDAMTVTLAHRHSFLFGALGNEMQLRARSSMRIEPSTVITP
jgi:Flp pilus assembly protein TadG